MKTITAADANRFFSSMLREVIQGEEITVTSRGKPVATVCPIKAIGPDRLHAKTALIERLRTQKAHGIRNWTRAELYHD